MYLTGEINKFSTAERLHMSNVNCRYELLTSTDCRDFNFEEITCLVFISNKTSVNQKRNSKEKNIYVKLCFYFTLIKHLNPCLNGIKCK